MEIFDRTHFRGRSTVLRANEEQLGRIELGDNSVRSLEVSCIQKQAPRDRGSNARR